MTKAEFVAIRDMIHRRSGIFFGDDFVNRLTRRIEGRLSATNCRNFTEYYLYLTRSAEATAEFEQIVELITTHETYFFRERNQLNAFSYEILPELHERLYNQKRLRIWSAGCATGEEVYTIIMLIMEHGGFKDWKIEVFGSDISRKVISRARQATYGFNSFRQTDRARISKYFEDDGERYRVRSNVRAHAAFGAINLVDPQSIALVSPVDLIFCRNVLIYFHHESKRNLAEMFYSKLRPGGYLLLGHAESLLNISTDFEVVSLRNDLVYRRPERIWRRP